MYFGAVYGAVFHHICHTVFVWTVFSEELLVLTIAWFSNLHNALRQSMHAIIKVTSYLVGKGSLLPPQEPHPLSALRVSIQPPYLLFGSTPMLTS